MTVVLERMLAIANLSFISLVHDPRNLNRIKALIIQMELGFV